MVGSSKEIKDVAAAQQPAVSAAAAAVAATVVTPTSVEGAVAEKSQQADEEQLNPGVVVLSDTTDVENPSDVMKSYPERSGVSARFRDAATGMSTTFTSTTGGIINFASRRPRTLCCCSFSILVITMLVVLFWPKDPTWRLVELDMDQDAFQSMIAAVTGQANETIPLHVTSRVEVKNSNFVGASTNHGKYTVETAKGGYQIASGTSRETVVPARGSAVVVNDVVVDFPMEVGPILVTDALQNGGIIQMIARVSANAEVFFLSFTTTVTCWMDINVFYSMDPERIIESKTCEYTYF